MKKITKVLAIVMTLAMLLSMTAMVASADETTGTIKLNNPEKDSTYHLYKILDLYSYDSQLGAYLYTIESAWTNFFATGADGLTYMEIVKINSVDYVQWKAATDDATVAAFAKAALAYAKANSITATKTAAPADHNGAAYTFNNLDLGYYLMDSSLGALCSLTTTDPDAEVTEKNEGHTIDKVVQEDSTSNWGTQATYQIGDTVPFKVTIVAKKGAESLVMHDIMEAGLTLNKDSITVKVNDVALDAANYTITHNPAAHTNGKQCTFEIAFAQSYLNTITADTTIVVEYSAVLNENAELHTDTNDNTTWMTAGDDYFTEEKTVTVKTFLFDLVKTDSNKKMLAGAKFELYDASTGGNKIELVKIDDNTYRVATAADKAKEGYASAVIVTNNAAIKIQGLDGDAKTTYYLHETEAPAGYNLLDARVPVKLYDENTQVGINLASTIEGGVWVSGGVQIENKTGTVLPETGGIGTTLFVLFGSMTALCAAVVLVARKKTAGYR